jgi:hypothetical protein
MHFGRQVFTKKKKRHHIPEKNHNHEQNIDTLSNWSEINTQFNLQKHGHRDVKGRVERPHMVPLINELLQLALVPFQQFRKESSLNIIYIYKNVMASLCVVCSKSQSSESRALMALQFGHNVAGEYAHVWM